MAVRAIPGFISVSPLPSSFLARSNSTPLAAALDVRIDRFDPSCQLLGAGASTHPHHLCRSGKALFQLGQQFGASPNAVRPTLVSAGVTIRPWEWDQTDGPVTTRHTCSKCDINFSATHGRRPPTIRKPRRAAVNGPMRW